MGDCRTLAASDLRGRTGGGDDGGHPPAAATALAANARLTMRAPVVAVMTFNRQRGGHPSNELRLAALWPTFLRHHVRQWSYTKTIALSIKRKLNADTLASACFLLRSETLKTWTPAMNHASTIWLSTVPGHPDRAVFLAETNGSQ